VWKPIDGVGDAKGVGGRNVDAITAIMVETGANVIASSGVDSEGFSFFGSFVDEDFDSWWGEWRFVEIESTEDLGVCRELWVDAGGAKEVQRECGLWKEFVPQIKGEVRMCAAEAGDEMVFKRLNCTFGPIAAMESCWCELIVDAFFSHEIGEEL
jgi:hypothetical protein